MLSALNWLVDFFTSIGSFLSMLIESLLTALSVVATAITMPLTLTPFLPSIVVTSVMCVVSLAVVKFILGR